MKPMKEGSIENTNVQMIQTRKLAVTVVLLGIEHLCLNMYTNPLTLPKKGWFKDALSHTIPNLHIFEARIIVLVKNAHFNSLC